MRRGEKRREPGVVTLFEPTRNHDLGVPQIEVNNDGGWDIVSEPCPTCGLRMRQTAEKPRVKPMGRKAARAGEA